MSATTIIRQSGSTTLAKYGPEIASAIAATAASRAGAETAETGAGVAQVAAELAATNAQLSVVNAIESLSGTPIGMWLPFGADANNGGILPFRSAASFPNNMFHYPNGMREAVQQIVLFSTSNATLTYDYGAGPNTDDRSLRIVSSTTAGYLRTASTALDAGTYTMAMEVRAASAVNFKFGHLATLDTIAATTSWQTVTKTFTHAGGNITAYWALGDGVDLFDLEVSQPRISVGSSDLGIDAISYPLFFGRTRDDTVNPASFDPPSWRGRALIPLGRKETISELAMLFAINRPSPNAEEALVYPIIQNGAPSDRFSINAQGGGVLIYLNGKALQIDLDYLNIPENGWCVIGVQAGPTGAIVYKNGVPVKTTNTAITAFDAASWQVRCDNIPETDARLGPVAIWHERLSSSDFAAASEIVAQQVRASNIVVPSFGSTYISAGDSITWGQGVTSSYSELVMIDRPTLSSSNIGIQSHTLDDQMALIEPMLEGWKFATARGRKIALSMMIGRNDSAELIADPAAYYARVMAQMARIRAAGALVIMCDILPSDPAGFNTARAAFNALLAANVGIDLDYHVDFTSVAAGQDGAELNVALYSDGTHPTQAGHDQLDPLLGVQVDLAIAS